jgi:hypothetical protein
VNERSRTPFGTLHTLCTLPLEQLLYAWNITSSTIGTRSALPFLNPKMTSKIRGFGHDCPQNMVGLWPGLDGVP